MLVGFIDGDGYICIARTHKKYIKLCLVISLDIKDISILEYIHANLKLGKINTYPKAGKKHTCKLVIHKTDLQDVLFPLFIHHNICFLTQVRLAQYCKAVYVIENDIKMYSDIPSIIKFDNNDIIPKIESKDIVGLPYFDN